MDKVQLKRRIAVSSGKEPADCVIKNGKIIDVFNGEIRTGDIAIVDGYFAGIGSYEGKTIINAEQYFVSPAFIDGHVHIESSMVSPLEFAKVLLKHGVTTVITDPHEIANVSGAKGIQYMLDSTENLPFDFYFMLPSCVPAVGFECAGAVLEIEDLKPFYSHPRVLGLAEVMNFPAVLNGEDSMLKKISETKAAGKLIDGHAAGLKAKDLNVYMSAHIRTDHECTTLEEAKARIQAGMYLMIREGTVARDLRNLIGVVNSRNARRCLFVTDDKHLDDLIEEGSIDYNIRLAIQGGLDPIAAVQMATINAAECFGLKDIGAIAPGYKADFVLLKDLETISVCKVFKNGNLVMDDGQLRDFPPPGKLCSEVKLRETVLFHPIKEKDLHIHLESKSANVIEIIPNSLVTRHIVEKMENVGNGLFRPSIQKDLLKMAVIERHHMTGQIGLAIVKGLGLKSGAIASTVAHDSHNLIVAGTNDHDMCSAANEIKAMQGGLIVVNNGEKIASLPLPIAGLMSENTYEEVYKNLQELNNALRKLGASDHFNPFLTLSFLALPVIPELKLTVQGLFHVPSFKHIPLTS